MLNESKFTQYCQGKGYLHKRAYADASARERFDSRVAGDISQAMRTAAQQPQQSFVRSSLPFMPVTPPPTLMQRLAQFVQQPLASMAQLVRNVVPSLPQPLQAMGARAERLMEGVMSFFSPKKKLKSEEQEKRLEDDVIQTELFGTPVVEASQGSGFGGGQR